MARAYSLLPNIYVEIGEDVFEIIQLQVPVAEESLKMLRHSLDRCAPIRASTKNTPDELEKLEALKNRFIRVCDLFFEVFLPLTDKIDREKDGTIVDSIKRAEKKKVIDKAGMVIDIRNLRNDLARLHLPDAAGVYIPLITEYSPRLFDYFDNFITYARLKKLYPKPDNQ
ncbi:MAG: hypothetical protein WD266_08065 [Balneolales bacterium]